MSRSVRAGGVAVLLAVLSLTGISGSSADEPEPGPGNWDRVALEGVGAGAEPASVADCPAGRLCLWSQGGHSGALWTLGKSKVVTDVGAAASPARSAWNRSGGPVRLFSGTGGTGSVTCVGNGWSGNLTTAVRSVQMVGSC